jgi:hypothetical protein
LPWISVLFFRASQSSVVGLELLSKNNAELKSQLDYTTKELHETKKITAQALTALSHVYMFYPSSPRARTVQSRTSTRSRTTSVGSSVRSVARPPSKDDTREERAALTFGAAPGERPNSVKPADFFSVRSGDTHRNG